MSYTEQITNITNDIITDINSEAPNNNNQFVIIKSRNIKRFLIPIGKHENGTIYDYDKKRIDELFEKYNLNADIWCPMGNVFIGNYETNELLFANALLPMFEHPTSYEIVEQTRDGLVIWKPSGSSGFDNIGLVCTNTLSRPSRKATCLINTNFITNFEDRFGEPGITHGNEFGLLTTLSSGRRTIIRSLVDTNDSSEPAKHNSFFRKASALSARVCDECIKKQQHQNSQSNTQQEWNTKNPNAHINKIWCKGNIMMLVDSTTPWYAKKTKKNKKHKADIVDTIPGIDTYYDENPKPYKDGKWIIIVVTIIIVILIKMLV